MSTQLYFRASTAIEPKPNVKQSADAIYQFITSTLGGGQDSAGSIFPLDMLTTIGTDNSQTIRQTFNEPGIAHFEWFKAWISPELDGAQTISGTLNFGGDFVEGSNTQNMNPRLYIYQWNANDTKGSDIFPITTSGVEADTQENTFQFFFAAQPINIVALADGDRIVAEVEAFDNNTLTASRLHAINFDGTFLMDRDTHISFSTNLIFKTAAQPQPTTQGIVI